ncbi:hypothetical protein LWI28_011090 [Acer negundo]|uniref:Uncharacterized protein n=1 Tax=Acer negundo TaxID=4023 RepID=A0AAD5P1F7_ACENE|nr:hypothetical protein LWI28_011090 [Acer negundo]
MPLNKIKTSEEKKTDVVEEATEFSLTKWITEEVPAQEQDSLVPQQPKLQFQRSIALDKPKRDRKKPESLPDVAEIDSLTDQAMDYSSKVARHSGQLIEVQLEVVIGAHVDSVAVGQIVDANMSQIITPTRVVSEEATQTSQGNNTT